MCQFVSDAERGRLTVRYIPPIQYRGDGKEKNVISLGDGKTWAVICPCANGRMERGDRVGFRPIWLNYSPVSQDFEKVVYGTEEYGSLYVQLYYSISENFLCNAVQIGNSTFVKLLIFTRNLLQQYRMSSCD